MSALGPITRRQLLTTASATAALSALPVRLPLVGAYEGPRRRTLRKVHGIRKLAKHLGIPDADLARVAHPPFPEYLRHAEFPTWTTSIAAQIAVARRQEQIRALYTTLASREPTPEELARAFHYLLDTDLPTSRRAWLSTAHAQDSGGDVDVDLGTLTNVMEVSVTDGSLQYLNPMNDFWADKPFFGQLYDFGRSLARVFGFGSDEPWVSGGARQAIQAEYNAQVARFNAYQQYIANGWWQEDPQGAFYDHPDSQAIQGWLSQYIPDAIHMLSAFEKIGVGLGLIGLSGMTINQAVVPVWKEFAAQVRMGAVVASVAYGFVGLNLTITGPGLALVGLGLIAIALAFEVYPVIEERLLPHSNHPGADGLVGATVEVVAQPYINPLNPGATTMLEDIWISYNNFFANPHYWVQNSGVSEGQGFIVGGQELGEPLWNQNPSSLNGYANGWAFTWNLGGWG